MTYSVFVSKENDPKLFDVFGKIIKDTSEKFCILDPGLLKTRVEQEFNIKINNTGEITPQGTRVYRIDFEDELSYTVLLLRYV